MNLIRRAIVPLLHVVLLVIFVIAIYVVIGLKIFPDKPHATRYKEPVSGEIQLSLT